MKSNLVSFVIPTKNEEKTISNVINGLKSASLELGLTVHEIIVTDDSSDKTRKIAESLGASIVCGGSKGLGYAMFRGLKRAARGNPDVIISLDGDGQVDISELKDFIHTLDSQEADMVVGSRFLNKSLIGYKYPLINRMGTIILSWILRRLTKLPLTDSHGGIRAVKPKVIHELEMIGSHTYVQETIIDASENGFKIIEIASKWNVRQHGKSRVVGSISKYIFYTLPVLILRSKQHIEVFFVTGIMLVLMAFIHIIVVAWQTNFSIQQLFDRQSFHLFFLLLSIGFNFFFFGVTLELPGPDQKE